jgi:N-acetylglucosamine kinase-like BadF-type ATPase
MLADLNGDGALDLVSSHAQPDGGLVIWAHPSTGTSLSARSSGTTLRSGGRSYARSRQLAGDIDGDGHATS